jgi:hypothetical protein
MMTSHTEVEGALFLDVIIGQDTTVLELLDIRKTLLS